MAPDDYKEAVRLSALAAKLSRSLEEFAHSDIERPPEQTKEIYDTTYLPQVIEVSQQVTHWVPGTDVQVLREPLHPDLGDAQLNYVIKTLDFIAVMLNCP